jgi:hypothetical protein
MPPKLLDIRVEIPPPVAPDGDVDDAVVVDAGADNPAERTTFVHFYATAIAVLIESKLGFDARTRALRARLAHPEPAAPPPRPPTRAGGTAPRPPTRAGGTGARHMDT